MPVSIKFESDQAYQLDAIEAVCRLFSGWRHASENAQSFEAEQDALFQEAIFANSWGIDDSSLSSNAREIQAFERESLRGESVPVIPEGLRLSEDDLKKQLRDFSVEMETGTGKTYVYLRTAIELYLRFGLSKFIVVVPSVAIREGVLSSLKLMKKHFQQIYSGLHYESYMYESRNVTRLRQFASSNSLQFLVMNIQAFTRDDAVIKRQADGLNGRAPIDFITSANPVVIMDEPQKLDTSSQQRAIAKLNPLFRLRYSATHKNRHCLVYRLGPVDAYEQELVKRIQVLSMSSEEDRNSAYVEVHSVNTSGGGTPTATISVNMPHARVRKTIKVGENLRDLTDSVVYQGWILEQIHVETPDSPAFLEFQNGKKISLRENTGIDLEWWQRAQIAATIEQHLDTELRIHQAASVGDIFPTKVLTLFFIDRVANYAPSDGKFRVWFEELYEDLCKDRKYRSIADSLERFSAKEVHKGYFASTRGTARDTSGDTSDDAEAYKLIMKDKEALLSLDQPVKFIFSHSALSEGWDNPNVFVICNLQETQSEMRRRQQIGRGLRLPVMSNGERSRQTELNILTVVASETFERFAGELQREIAEETGETFEGQVKDKRDRATLELKEGFEEMPGFKELWSVISPKTFYRLSFETDDIVDEAVKRLKELMEQDPIRVPVITVARGMADMQAGKGVKVSETGGGKQIEMTAQRVRHDILTDLANQLMVSRNTIHRIMTEAGKLDEAKNNPAKYQQHVRTSIRAALAHTVVDKSGISYFPLLSGDKVERYSAEYFKIFEPQAYANNLVDVKHSIYKQIPVDSEVERRFAQALDERGDIKLFLKLPSWFKIDTPIGKYNPDWAIVRTLPTGGDELYLVRETKGSNVLEELRFEGERWKVQFGKSHFGAISVDYKQVVSASELDAETPIEWDDGSRADV